jgi:hypothetical protein
MPYIPISITNLAAGNVSGGIPIQYPLFAYTNTVSQGQAQPDGVKSITAGYGIGGGGSSGAVSLSNTGIQTITAGTGVSVSTSGATTTITATASGAATSGTFVSYETNPTFPITFAPNASTVLCTLQTPTTNNYAEVTLGFVPAVKYPHQQPVIQPAGGAIGLGIYLSYSPSLTPTMISNCYGSMIAETSAVSNIPFPLPDPTAQSEYPTNAVYLSAVSPTPVDTWYVVASNFQGSVPYISSETTFSILSSLYANNVVTS